MQVLEKILQEIEKAEKDILENPDGDYLRGNANFAVVAKEIIQSHMKNEPVSNPDKLDDGWIPVEERLPEVAEGTEDAYCPEFNVTIKGASESTTLKYSWDGTWFDDSGYVYDVIAWQPLPEPYQPEKGGAA